MAKATDSAAALEIIESWGWDCNDPRFEFSVPLMMPLSEVINRLAMEGGFDAASATLALLSEGKLEATGSYKWKAYRAGHYQREAIGYIPESRWTVLRDGLATRKDWVNPDELELHLVSSGWNGSKEPRASWLWDKDHFATAQKADCGFVLDPAYFEETYSASDIELRPASAFASETEPDTPRQSGMEQNRGGAPAKYDWERAVAAIVFQWADEGTWQPTSQADVKRRLADWFAENNQHPSDSLLKERAKWLFEEFRRRAGEADNLAA